jgi:hypothetical protein
VTAEEAIVVATRWLAQSAVPHGPLRSAYFRWRFELVRWADHFCYHSYQAWKQAVRAGPVEERHVLLEKWRITFDSPGAEGGQGYGHCVRVDVDDRTGQVCSAEG